MTYDQNTPSDSTALTLAEPVYQTVKTVTVMDNVLLHATGIKAAWNKQVAGIIETGQLLLKAKKELSGSGKFLKLFDKTVGDLPFCEDTAQRLMQIARHPVLSDAEHVRHLPPHWGTLAVLSRATPKQVKKWIMDGTVNVDTDRMRAESLVAPKPAKGRAEVKQDADDATDSDDVAANVIASKAQNEVQQAVQHLYTLATDVKADWTNADFEMVRDLVEELQSKIDARRQDALHDAEWQKAEKGSA
jgi:hypothetical protein